jgi:signal transduction histidine kinase
VIRALSAYLRDHTFTAEAAEIACHVVIDQTGAQGAMLESRGRDGSRCQLAHIGAISPPSETFPLRHHGEDLGWLTVSARSRPGVEAIADQLAPMLAAGVLREELRAGRERAVAAREEERRRLHRDIHDDLGPAVAGIRLRLDTAAERLAHEPGVRRLVLDAIAQTSSTLEEIHRIVDDLRPPDLDEHGLPEAVRRLVARLGATSPRIVVDAPDLPLALPAATEVAAYRIVAEGLTNALRHSRARQVTVRLAVNQDDLVMDIADDGAGPSGAGRIPCDGHGWRPGPGPGTGLASMRQRAEDVGGRCVVLPLPGKGTLARAVLPRKLA